MSTDLSLEIWSGKDVEKRLWQESLPNQASRVLYTHFEDFGTQMVRKLAPHYVLSPLFSDGFDCIDVGRCLTNAAFTGEFCILAEALPNTAMVQGELQRQFPSLNLRVIANHDAPATVKPEPCQALA